MNSVARLNNTELPPKSAFYSRLNDSDISDENYEHAKSVWKCFGCKTLREYHNLYNISDVLLLADIFENSRDVCVKNYQLDPAWYYTSPGLPWDAALKSTSIDFELLSDYNMILMIKQGIGGGISQIKNKLMIPHSFALGLSGNSSRRNTPLKLCLKPLRESQQ